MHAELQSYHTFDSTKVACYARLSALSQRRAAGVREHAEEKRSEASLHTLGLFVLALQVQDGAAPVSSGSRVLIDIVTKATVINQAVLAILIVISVASWAIILSKSIAYRKVARQTSQFLDAFRKSSKFSEVQAVCSTLPLSPLVGVFQAGYAELNAQFRLTQPQQQSNPSGAATRPTIKSLTAVDRALLRAATVEINKLEKRVPFLATVASVAPFIGLFGTVVGITIAFQRIGTTGSTNLAVVGPSISEALIATAAGLFAAIPAVLAYNHFSTRVKIFAAEMDDFSMEFLNIAERNFT
jgi:biopolymer transport protein TolQ